jgi:hypothetical protein
MIIKLDIMQAQDESVLFECLSGVIFPIVLCVQAAGHMRHIILVYAHLKLRYEFLFIFGLIVTNYFYI